MTRVNTLTKFFSSEIVLKFFLARCVFSHSCIGFFSPSHLMGYHPFPTKSSALRPVERGTAETQVLWGEAICQR